MDKNTTASDSAPSDPDDHYLRKYCAEENLLGSGGYGEVYRGRFEIKGVERDVAIKRIPRDKLKHDENREAELQLLQLSHPNVLEGHSRLLKDVKYG